MYPDYINILCHLGDHNYNVTNEDRGVEPSPTTSPAQGNHGAEDLLSH